MVLHHYIYIQETNWCQRQRTHLLHVVHTRQLNFDTRSISNTNTLKTMDISK